MNLALAERLANDVLAEGKHRNLLPLTVAIIDAGGHLLVLKRQDGSSTLRPQIALAKASGCVALGFGGREQASRAVKAPAFFAAVSNLTPQGLVPVPGGVLICNVKGAILGAVGVTGDSSDNDEACALAAISNAGFLPKAGL